MDRAEGTGLTVSLLGHVGLAALLSLGFLAAQPPEKPKPSTIEVTLSDQVGLESQAPDPSLETPAARLSPVEAPVEPEEAEAQPESPASTQPPRPQPPTPQRAELPTRTPPRPPQPSAPARQAQQAVKQPHKVQPTGNLDGIVKGLSNSKTSSQSTQQQAAKAGPDVVASLAAEIRRQIKPKWRGQAPTGADADKLVTIIRVRLNRDGSLAGKPQVVRQTGVTPSNSAQSGLHKERAIRAVELAAPFKLPAQFYDAWKNFETSFDKRLGQ